MAIVRAEGLTRDYGTGSAARRALDTVDVDIGAGEMVAIMGPSGSGKTTLLNLLGALDTPTAGDVYYDDRRLSAMDDDERTELRRNSLGFVFQAFNLVPVLSAVENVVLPLVIDKVPKAVREARAEEVLDLVGLGSHRHQMPADLSGGEQQRVAVARALVRKPKVVFADEPTGNLDTESGVEVMELLAEVRSGVGHAVVLVTHDERMAGFAGRTIRLVDGRVVEGSDTPSRG